MFEMLKKIFCKPRCYATPEEMMEWSEKIRNSKPGGVIFIPNNVFKQMTKGRSTNNTDAGK